MAARSNLARRAVVSVRPHLRTPLRSANAIADASALPVSPATVLQRRLAEAFVSPPSASRLKAISSIASVFAATWLAGVLLYATF